MDKLGLIAGGGTLPVEVAEFCERAGRPFCVVRLKGFAGPELQRFPGFDAGLAEIGKTVDGLKRAGAKTVCFAGNVSRPDFAKLAPDLKGLSLLPGAIAAARNGDDALLRFVVGAFEKEGFRVEGADQVTADLLLTPGALGSAIPADPHLADVRRAIEVAHAIGRLDVGQGAVVCDGLVLAVEAQEGTDAMLRRVAELPSAIRGSPGRRKGVLAKAPKPIQERRVDLPVIGVRTVTAAAEAGLAGIAGEAGALLVLEREAVIDAADRLGLFIWGVPPIEDPV